MLTTVLIFIALIAVLILVHEAGHFFAAKRAGVRVEEFGFGFPPRMMSWQKGETTYSLNWVWLGGFVKIHGEEGEGTGDRQSFASRSVATRGLIVAAGVLMNFLLAAALFSTGRMIGLPTVVEEPGQASRLRDLKIQIIEVRERSPAKEAGLAIGDTIIAVNGQRVSEVDEVQRIVEDHRGKEIVLEILHDGQPRTLRVAPRLTPPSGEGPLGLAMVKTGTERLSWYRAIPAGIRDTFALSWLFLKGLWGIALTFFTSGRVAADVAGPVGIAAITGRVAKLGLTYLLQFAAMLSLNLAIINLLPIPALDGGRLVFLLIEKLKGRALSQHFEQTAHRLGFALLITLMVLITIRDIAHYF